MSVRSISVLVLSSALVLGMGCRSQTPGPTPVSPAEAGATAATSGPRSGEATLLLMADIRGVLRPCGCVVELQKGGFDRLAPYLEKERKASPDAKLVHAGPLFYEHAVVEKDKVAQRKRQAEVTAQLLAEVDVAAAGATAVDLAAAGDRLPKLLETAKLPVTVANLKASGLSNEPIIQTVGDLRVALFALASTDHAEDLGERGTLSDPVEAAAATVAALQGRADVVILLSSLGLRHTKRLLRKVEGIHFALAGGLGEHPVFSDEAELIGSTRLMQFHREGRYVGRLHVRIVDGGNEVFVDASAPSEAELAMLDERIAQLETSLKAWSSTRGEDDKDVRSAKHHLGALQAERKRLGALDVKVPADRSSFSFRLTPLNWDLPQDPAVLKVMDAFDEELRGIALKNAGTLPEPEPGEAVYVGQDECLTCHDDAETFWENDRHPDAWETLEDMKKTFDAECVSCHVTGYGQAGGSIIGQTHGREDVQCEACHGPGSLHVEADGDVDIPIADPGEDVCVQCHNSHHSPNFEFAKWKKKITVPGHGLPLE